MLKLGRIIVFCAATAVYVSSTPTIDVAVAEDLFTLARVIPNDVFVFENGRCNPDRAFLDEYWGEVFETLKNSGLDESLAELFATMAGADDQRDEEVARLKDRFAELLAGVDWKQFKNAENAFAERFSPLKHLTRHRPVIGTPSFVWLCKGSDTPRENYEGLVAILETIVAETNKALEREALEVKQATHMGTEIASVDLLAVATNAPSLPLSVALRDETVMIALRKDLLHDVLQLMDGSSSKTALADDPRFAAAFAQLPTATDSMVFFDMQALVGPMLDAMQLVFDSVVKPGDVYENTGMNAEASKLNIEALFEYRRGNIADALKLVQQAHEIEPRDSVIVYNLACFNALSGHKAKALDWLEKAVDQGFYAPGKIAMDDDLKALRDEPQYKQALAEAARLAAERGATDVTLNYDDHGEARRLRMLAAKAYKKKDLNDALGLIEQAYKVAPNDSLVMYDMGCLHVLKGHKDEGLDYLVMAVDGGCYCPNRIAKDSDWDGVRDDARYQRALITAKKMAAEASAGNRGAKTQLIRRLVERLGEAAATIDYAATVETTDGFSVHTESVTVLVPDAQEQPIYPVIGQGPSLTDFARYLPEETKAFSISGGFNVRELHKFMEDTLRGGGPLGEEMLDSWEKIQEQIGLNLKQDVIDLIEGNAISVTLEDGGTLWMMKVSDEEKAYQKLDEAMAALPKLISQAISNKPAMGALAAFVVRSSPLTHDELDGFQGISMAMSPKPIGVWGTADGYLIFGSSADAVALCLATAQGEHPNIENNKTAMSEAIVPDGSFVSMSLSNRRTTAKEIATVMGTASMMGGMVAMSIPKPEIRPVVNKMIGVIGKLAPVIGKVDFYKSTAASTSFDGKQWRARSVTHYQDPAERAQEGDEAEIEDEVVEQNEDEVPND